MEKHITSLKFSPSNSSHFFKTLSEVFVVYHRIPYQMMVECATFDPIDTKTFYSRLSESDFCEFLSSVAPYFNLTVFYPQTGSVYLPTIMGSEIRMSYFFLIFKFLIEGYFYFLSHPTKYPKSDQFSFSIFLKGVLSTLKQCQSFI